jgi:hypothetical protein
MFDKKPSMRLLFGEANKDKSIGKAIADFAHEHEMSDEDEICNNYFIDGLATNEKFRYNRK